MEEYFEIGQIVNTTGLKGVIKIKPFTDDITRFEDLDTIYIDINNKLVEFTIEDVKYIKNMVLLKLKGIDTIEQAEEYRNYFIKINRKDAEDLPEDTYYIVDLIDCEVYSDENIFLGKVADVLQTGSNDVYVVKQEQGKDILLPAIADVVKDIDVANKKIIVHLLKGLID